MKVATYNVNSIRVRIGAVLEWLDKHRPDVLMLQETKCENDKFPTLELAEAGWHIAAHGQKSYNGVAIISREPLQSVRLGFVEEFDEDYRVISGIYKGVRLINTYVPNGSSLGSDKFVYKLVWLAEFKKWLERDFSASEPVLWAGDINIAPTSDDVFSPERHFGRVGHHPDEMALLARIMEWGFEDCFRKFHSGPGHYSFWEFVIPNAVKNNLGWRIDHIYATAPLAARCISCEIDKAPRLAEKPSDHTFVLAEFRD